MVASQHLYGASRALLEGELPRRGITPTTLIDPESREDWERALTLQTGVLFLEVPTNPTLRVFDVRVPAEIARDREILLAVDGTFASPTSEWALSSTAVPSIWGDTPIWWRASSQDRMNSSGESRT